MEATYKKVVENVFQHLSNDPFNDCTNIIEGIVKKSDGDEVLLPLKVLLYICENLALDNCRKGKSLDCGFVLDLVRQKLNDNSENCLVKNSEEDLLLIIGSLFRIAYKQDNNNDNILALAKFYHENLEFINDNYSSGSSDKAKLILRLRIVSCFFEASNNEIQFVNLKNFLRVIDDLKSNSNLDECKLFTNLVIHGSPDILKTVLFAIRHFIQYFDNDRLTATVWNEISKLFSCKNAGLPYTRMLMVLCYLFDYFFPESNETISFPGSNFMRLIFNDGNFWQLVQFGLANGNSLMKKQAMFLFKKSIALLSKSDEKITCSNGCQVNRGVIADDAIIWWDSKCKDEILGFYSELIVILEFLDEQQVHLIKPMFKMVEEFNCRILNKIRQGQKTIDLTWILLIHEQALRHDSTQVVKWGLESLLNLGDEFFSNPNVAKTTVDILVQTLNNTNLYYNEGLSTSEKLTEFFVKFGKLKTAKTFFSSFITTMCSFTWSPESLFFVTCALSKIPRQRLWGDKEISDIKTFVRKALKTYNKTIRTGIQCQLLQSINSLLDEKNIKLENLMLCLSSFSNSGALERGTQIWDTLVLQLRTCYSLEEAKSHMEKHTTDNLDEEIHCDTMALTMMMFFDVYDCCDASSNINFITVKLRGILQSYENIERRLYCNVPALNSNLSLVCKILDRNKNCIREKMSPLLKIIISQLRDLVVYIKMQMMQVSKLQDFHEVSLYVRTFENIMVFQTDLIQNALNELCQIITHGISVYEKSPETIPPIRIYCWMQLLKTITKSKHFHSCHGENLRVVHSYLSKYANESLVRDVDTFEKTIDLQTLWGRINSEFLESKWEILENLTGRFDENSTNHEKRLELCREALHVGGYGVLLPVMSLLKNILPKCEQIHEMVHSLWNLIAERRKTESFKKLTNSFVEMLFQWELINREADMQEVHLMYANAIFADSSQAIANGFIRHVQKLSLGGRVHPLLGYVLARSLLFGPVQRKDERLTAQVCSCVEATNVGNISEYVTSSEVRGRAVAVILSLDKTNGRHQKFARELVKTLFDVENDLTKGKLRYFGDSHVHRVKHRLVQALLLLEPMLHDFKETVDHLCMWLYNGLIHENAQPSVVYLQEWLLIRILMGHPELLNNFWSKLSDSVDMKTKGVCCLITVSYHLCKLVPARETSSWLDKAISTVLPFCMDQHFEARLYSQVVIGKLYQVAKDRNLTEIVEKYNTVHESVSKSIQRGCKGNAGRNCKKLQEDFFFTVFDPFEHYTLETIYRNISRLCNVGSDEWISTRMFRYCGVEERKNAIAPLERSTHSLNSVDCAKWCADGSSANSETESTDSSLSNYQKKMIPEKLAFPGLDDDLGRSGRICESAKKDGLVVVASLIDRIPNLGGLARTCEIFGASEYVMNSMKHTEDKQFASLSVTAEKWVTVKEVKRQNLSAYLFEMKNNGYTIVGAEQMLHSVPLNSVKLPKKSLILLGNEKEGIPPNLLPLLDICVEVPQVGIIRSLNVHVTGALFIWEYAKQNYF